jgi:hypothetical protein
MLYAYCATQLLNLIATFQAGAQACTARLTRVVANGWVGGL